MMTGAHEMTWRRKREHEPVEEVTGVHELSLQTLRGTRANLSSLIDELRHIKNEVEEAVRTGDLEPFGRGDQDEHH